jgi:uncharacterized protein (TIGR02646 family)
MKYIRKDIKNQPKSLLQYKKFHIHTYEDYREKDELRLALLKEQGYICCYCMQRIQEPTADKMVIEHFKPESIYNGQNDKPDLTLDYRNLFASCQGGADGPKNLFHCDETKKNIEISINPSDKKIMDFIKFGSDGRVYTDIEKIDNEINEVLRLNIQPLRNARKAIWKSLDHAIQKEFGDKTVTKSFINQQLKHWSSGKTFEPFCQVAIFYLQKKLPKAKGKN